VDETGSGPRTSGLPRPRSAYPAQRKPMLLFRFVGSFLLRFETIMSAYATGASEALTHAAEQNEIVHVAEIQARTQLPHREVVQWIQVDVREKLRSLIAESSFSSLRFTSSRMLGVCLSVTRR
jgi:hypothetical protein